MNRTVLMLLVVAWMGCRAQNSSETAVQHAIGSAENTNTDVAAYAAKFPDNGLPSTCTGTPGNGTLKNSPGFSNEIRFLSVQVLSLPSPPFTQST